MQLSFAQKEIALQISEVEDHKLNIQVRKTIMTEIIQQGYNLYLGKINSQSQVPILDVDIRSISENTLSMTLRLISHDNKNLSQVFKVKKDKMEVLGKTAQLTREILKNYKPD